MLLPPGKMWYDDDKKRDLKEKVFRALRHYGDEYLRFDTVFVHPSVLSEPVKYVWGFKDVWIKPHRSILRHHFLFCNLGNGEGAVGAQPTVTRTGG